MYEHHRRPRPARRVGFHLPWAFTDTLRDGPQSFFLRSTIFLSRGKAEFYSEILLEMMYARYGGAPPPLQHFITAYLQSAKIWVEAVRDGISLEAAMSQEASWRHLWTTYQAAPAGPKSGATNHGPDVDANIMNEFDKFKQQNRDLQSQRDKAIAQTRKNSEQGNGPEGKRRRVWLRPAAKGAGRR